MDRTYSVVACGSLAKKPGVLLALGKSGLAETFEPPERSHGLPTDEKTGWLHAYTDDLHGVQAIIEDHKWKLRLHSLTPKCSVCSGHAKDQMGQPCIHCNGAGRRNHPKPPVTFTDPLADLAARVAALEARGMVI
jgi:hypothetical protein